MSRIALVAGLSVVLVGCANAEIGDPSDNADASSGGPDGGGADGTPGVPDASIPDAAPPPDAAPCVEGEVNVEDPATGHCYMYFSTTVPWDVALGACGSVGSGVHLAVITSPEENAVVASILAGVNDVWLGGTDQMVEGTWVWITGESMLLYDNWRDGEPNNGGTNGEDCMIMELDNGGTWDDRNCGNQMYGYFCERE